jgi:hypothetical protein
MSCSAHRHSNAHSAVDCDVVSVIELQSRPVSICCRTQSTCSGGLADHVHVPGCSASHSGWQPAATAAWTTAVCGPATCAGCTPHWLHSWPTDTNLHVQSAHASQCDMDHGTRAHAWRDTAGKPLTCQHDIHHGEVAPSEKIAVVLDRLEDELGDKKHHAKGNDYSHRPYEPLRRNSTASQCSRRQERIIMIRHQHQCVMSTACSLVSLQPCRLPASASHAGDWLHRLPERICFLVVRLQTRHHAWCPP